MQQASGRQVGRQLQDAAQQVVAVAQGAHLQGRAGAVCVGQLDAWCVVWERCQQGHKPHCKPSTPATTEDAPQLPQ